MPAYLEDTRARVQAFVLTVPLDQLIDLCAFNGDMDKIAGHPFNQEIFKEATEIREDPPELPPRSMRGNRSPVKEGEDAEEKLLNETIKNKNVSSSASTRHGKHE